MDYIHVQIQYYRIVLVSLSLFVFLPICVSLKYFPVSFSIHMLTGRWFIPLFTTGEKYIQKVVMRKTSHRCDELRPLEETSRSRVPFQWRMLGPVGPMLFHEKHWGMQKANTTQIPYIWEDLLSFCRFATCTIDESLEIEQNVFWNLRFFCDLRGVLLWISTSVKHWNCGNRSWLDLHPVRKIPVRQSWYNYLRASTRCKLSWLHGLDQNTSFELYPVGDPTQAINVRGMFPVWLMVFAMTAILLLYPSIT